MATILLVVAITKPFLVSDKADRVLDVGFEVELRVIFKCLPKNRQTLLFSATMTSELEALLEHSANKAYFYEACDGFKTVATLQQQSYIGKQLEAFECKENEVLSNITKVYKAKRVAIMKMMDDSFDEKTKERKK
ncbi:hypothetical protein SO802_012821 [Lithocarpus litseifolius]|uniref:Helicase ATP-binding domain-containing protein n=1 Tax=Lithocarpus litseifolius TaxID=425828 RepID=A0AAW2D7U3_9ROSI